MSRQTAFHSRLAARTDQWMDLFGYAAPSVVSDTLEEYRAVRETAGLMDFSMLRKVDLDGAGALELLNSLVTRDLTKVRPGHIAYGALTDESGKMVDDCTASVFGPDRIRFCGANDRDFEIFAAAAAGTSVAVRHFTDEMPHLCLQGPLSRSILQPLTAADLSNTAFPYYTFKEEVTVAGIPVFMTRLGYTAELGFELWVAEERALELFDALVAAGEPAGMKVIGMDALDVFRIEGGFIIGGIEYDPTTSPYECGLGWAVDLDKGEFQGRQALREDKERTVFRLGSVMLASGGAAASGARLSSDGEEVGYITQAVVSPFLGGATLGLAKLRRPRHVAGTKVVASLEGEEVGGEVMSHPVYEPQRKKAKEKP
ncbi:MAG TPA: aminomethyltransferase family protein [Acidimicrobiales bacterium]|nr:aminomethyltransferase family protein [Acidimicrobiales bacterium]